MRGRSFRRAGASVAAIFLLSGCSAYMAASRQDYRGDPTVLQSGASRDKVEAKLGTPDQVTDAAEGKTEVVYKLDPNAVRRGTKAAEASLDVVADLMTFGLWELVATPVEMASKDKVTIFSVVYAPDNTVETVDASKDGIVTPLVAAKDKVIKSVDASK
jgi:hypothetical protein